MNVHPRPPSNLAEHANQHVTELLRHNASESHAAFTARLVPTVDAQTILGVKMGPTRAVARAVLADDDLAAHFLAATPHPFLEHNIVHILLLNAVKDLEQWQRQMEAFLPHIDNWMVTDAINPSIWKQNVDKHMVEKYLQVAHQWVAAPETYTIRSGIVVYLHSLRHRQPTQRDVEAIASISNSDYYTEMAAAWYFATAFNLNPQLLGAFIETDTGERTSLSSSVRKRTVQKILESRKTTPSQRDWARNIRLQLK